MKLFLFYENPITFMLGNVCRIKFCKKREKTQKVKDNMKRLSNRFDLKKILNKIDKFEIDIGRLMEAKKPPDGRTGGFNGTRDRWKKGPDKPQTRQVQEMMRSKVLNELTVSQQKITINKPEVMKMSQSQLKNH